MTQLSVYTSLPDFIAATNLQPGDRLPPERELSAQLGIPRTALRRQLSEMEAAGKLIRHVGRGTFIATPGNPFTLESSNGQSVATYPEEVLETRLLLEPAIAYLAAKRASQLDIQALEHAIARGRVAASHDEFEHWDAAFHRALAEATRNALLLSMYQQIDAVRAGKIWGKLKEASLTQERMGSYLNDHESITQAVSDRDPQRAEQAMRLHITATQASLLQH